jgi:hypothetical protein
VKAFSTLPLRDTLPEATFHPSAGLYGLGILQDVSGLPLTFRMRLLCALADIGTVAVVWLLIRRTGTTGLIVLLALSPTSARVSGFHVNTDPMMVFFVLRGR